MSTRPYLGNQLNQIISRFDAIMEL